MKKLKVIIASILTFIIASSVFAGCKIKVDNDSQTLEIYVANFGYGYEWLETLIDDFKIQPKIQEKYPNLKIAFTKNSDRGYALDKILQGETNTIDLLFSVASAADSYERTYQSSKPYFEDLSEVYDSIIDGEDISFKEKMDDNFLRMNTYTKIDGSQTYYSVPWVGGMQGLVYNKTLLDSLKLSAPRTTKELKKLCKDICEKGKTPFIFTSKENYWTAMMFLLWWAQYEGLDNYSNFYQGIIEENGKKVMSPKVFEQMGRLRSLETIAELITYPTNYIHENVNTLSFTQAQTRFLVGEGVMMPNGDWFEHEMSETAKTDNITDVFTFMKTPIISSIVETLEDATMSDEKLCEVITAIDGGETKFEGVSQNDFNKINASRKLILPIGNHSALIPAYATAKELAKDFLKFMATDRANEKFIEVTNGASMPFKYDIKNKTPELYQKLPLIQKTRLDLQNSGSYMMNESAFSGVYYGGIARFTGTRTNVESLFTAQNSKDRKTARQIFDEEIKYWSAERWDSVLENMGLK